MEVVTKAVRGGWTLGDSEDQVHSFLGYNPGAKERGRHNVIS